jgi:hypothetical protein
VIVGDFDFVGAAVPPSEADAPLVVDSDRMLSLAITSQRMQFVAWRQPEIVEITSGVNHQKLLTGSDENLVWEALGLLAMKNRLRYLVPEAPDHLNSPCPTQER